MPLEQLRDELLARDVQRLGGGIEIEPMPALVLDLGEERRLAAQRRRPGDPVALGQHADDLGMGVLRDLPHEEAAISLRHPVVRLDLLLGVDAGLEARLALRILGRADRLAGVEGLRVHAVRSSKRPAYHIKPSGRRAKPPQAA